MTQDVPAFGKGAISLVMLTNSPSKAVSQTVLCCAAV